MYCAVFAAYHRLLMDTYPVQDFTVPTARHASIGDRDSRQAHSKFEINISPTSSLVDCILASSLDTALTPAGSKETNRLRNIASLALSPSSIRWYTCDLTSLLPAIRSLALHTRTLLVSLTASSTPLSSKIHEDNIDLRIEGGPPAGWARDTCVIPLSSPSPLPPSMIAGITKFSYLHIALLSTSLFPHESLAYFTIPIGFPLALLDASFRNGACVRLLSLTVAGHRKEGPRN